MPGGSVDGIRIDDGRIPHIRRHKVREIIIDCRQGMIFVRIQIERIPEAGKNGHQGGREKSAEQHTENQFGKETLSRDCSCEPAYQKNSQYQKNAAAKRSQKPHGKGRLRTQCLKGFCRKHLGILSGYQKGETVLSQQLQI